MAPTRGQDIGGGSLPVSKEAGLAVDHAVVDRDVGSFDEAGEREPTEEEMLTLPHVAEKLPMSTFLVAIVELCERFTYYGCQGIFQNYVQRPLSGVDGRGALGM